MFLKFQTLIIPASCQTCGIFHAPDLKTPATSRRLIPSTSKRSQPRFGPLLGLFRVLLYVLNPTNMKTSLILAASLILTACGGGDSSAQASSSSQIDPTGPVVCGFAPRLVYCDPSGKQVSIEHHGSNALHIASGRAFLGLGGVVWVGGVSGAGNGASGASGDASVADGQASFGDVSVAGSVASSGGTGTTSSVDAVQGAVGASGALADAGLTVGASGGSVGAPRAVPVGFPSDWTVICEVAVNVFTAGEC